MKKYLIFILALVLISFPIFETKPQITFAQTSNQELVTLDDVETFISRAGNNRSAYSSGEKTASAYLAQKMQENNLSYYKSSTSYIYEFSVGINKSQNVIGVQKSAKDNAKTVILGAHYDNVYNFNGETTYSNGVFDNGSGVLCLLAIMKELTKLQLPYNIIYIFYGAEETGLHGSKNFVYNLSALDIKNTIMAFNFDSIGVGDYTYYYSGDSANSYKEIFANNNYNIKEMPQNKRINLLTNFEGYAYTHIGLMSDITAYLKKNIKCTTFFSGNLSHSGTGYIESENKNNISHTKNDNLLYITENYPNFLSSINNVANLTISTLTLEDFEERIEKSYNGINLFFLNNKIVIGSIFLVGILILFALKPKSLRQKV